MGICDQEHRAQPTAATKTAAFTAAAATTATTFTAAAGATATAVTTTTTTTITTTYSKVIWAHKRLEPRAFKSMSWSVSYTPIYELLLLLTDPVVQSLCNPLQRFTKYMRLTTNTHQKLDLRASYAQVYIVYVVRTFFGLGCCGITYPLGYF